MASAPQGSTARLHKGRRGNGTRTLRRRKLYAISFTIAVLTAALLTAGHARASATFSADSIGVFQGGGLDSDVATSATPVTVSSLVANINGTIHSTSETGR